MDQDQKTWLAGVFDRAASAYDRVGVPYHEHFARRLVDLAGIPAGAALLDVGCGRGAVLLAAAANGRAASLTGVDVSAGMLDRARADLGAGAARLEVMDAERLAFADGSFDALTAAFLLFFLPDPTRAAPASPAAPRTGRSWRSASPIPTSGGTGTGRSACAGSSNSSTPRRWTGSARRAPPGRARPGR